MQAAIGDEVTASTLSHVCWWRRMASTVKQ